MVVDAATTGNDAGHSGSPYGADGCMNRQTSTDAIQMKTQPIA